MHVGFPQDSHGNETRHHPIPSPPRSMKYIGEVATVQLMPRLSQSGQLKDGEEQPWT